MISSPHSQQRAKKAGKLLLACTLILSALSARSETPTPDGATEQSTDARFQSTYVWQTKPGFSARYSGDNSLLADREPRSYSLTATAFLGTRVWSGGELYFNPEMSLSQSLSSLHGLGGLSNGENQKGGGANPTFYRARLFLRQTWGMGGEQEQLESAPNQLAGSVDSRRLVLTAGNLSLLDIFDNNAYSHDPRTQFLNWTIMSSGAFDYASDARGYTIGAALEYYLDDLVFRIGRFMQPAESNGLPLDHAIFKHYGDQLEVEQGYRLAEHPGKLRVLLFRNRVSMGGFDDAVAAWRAAGGIGIPDVAAVRRERSKVGWGLNLEQEVTPDLGLFLRTSANDGKSETYAFTEVERSLSGGLSLRGTGWGRPGDVVGAGFAVNGLSAAHRQYLAAGGLGAFIGDGTPPAGTSFRYAHEQIFETYWSVGFGHGLWASLDYQKVRNPAYNTDRGPANFFGARFHVEY